MLEDFWQDSLLGVRHFGQVDSLLSKLTVLGIFFSPQKRRWSQKVLPQESGGFSQGELRKA